MGNESGRRVGRRPERRPRRSRLLAQHVGRRDARAHEIALQHEGHLGLGLGCNHRIGPNGLAFVENHARGHLSKVGLVDVEHFHHDLARDADFFAHDGFAGIKAALDHAQLNLVGILDRDPSLAIG